MAFCFENECGFELLVNERTVAKSDGSFGTSGSYVLGICTSDQDCNDHDSCTSDFCDVENRVCVFESLACWECNKEMVVIDINTDILFSLTAWDVKETQSNISVASAGPFVKSFTQYQNSICLLPGTYLFTMTNSEGRGMTICRYGFNCGYSLAVNGETIIESDGSFEYEKSHSFIICDTDSDCENGDSCSVGHCKATKLCWFERLPCSSCDKKEVKIVVDTDGSATETSWSLKNVEINSIFSSGGKFAKNHSRYIYDECLPKGEYLYTIYDQNEDGFASCGANENCGYTIAIDDEVIVDDTGDFGKEVSYLFNLCDNDPQCNKVNSTFVSTTSPTEMPFEIIKAEYLDILSVAVGFHHTCAVTNKGLIFCFGLNDSGQLGYGDKINRGKIGKDFPAIDIGNSNKAKEIFCGAFHTCILLVDDDLICFGDNRYGQLGIESATDIGSSAGQMGNALQKVNLGLGRKVKKVSLGYFHSCIILDNDTFKCWGNNDFGQLGQGRTGTIGDTKFEMGDKLGNVNLGGNDTVQDLSAGTYHTCIIQASQLKCFGKNSNGQLGYGDDINRGILDDSMGNHLPAVDIDGIPIFVSAGNSLTCVVLNDGNAKCFGYNKFGQLGYGDKLERGGKQNEMGSALPVIDVGDGQRIVKITRGSNSICILTSDNKVKCWGFNMECSLGVGDNRDRILSGDMGNDLPSIDFGQRNVKDIIMYHLHICALFDDNTLSCWGFNRFGQLGQDHHDSIGCDSSDMGDNLALVKLVETEKWQIKVRSERSSNYEYNKLRLVYDVSRNVRNGQLIASIFDKSCKTPNNTTSISTSTFLQDTSNNIYQEGLALVDIDYSTIESSDLWVSASNNSGTLEFCLRTDLVLSNQSDFSVSFAETVISAHFNFDLKFTNFEISDINLRKEENKVFEEKEILEVTGCICDMSWQCVEEPYLTQNSEINLCIMAMEVNVKVEKFLSVDFYQDGVLKFSPVTNQESMELTTTISGDIGVMKTRTLSMFFEGQNPSNLFISGTVLLSFQDRRRLQMVDIKNLSMQKQSKSTFQFQVPLAKRNNYTTLENIVMAFIGIICSIGYIIQKGERYGYSLLPTRNHPNF